MIATKRRREPIQDFPEGRDRPVPRVVDDTLNRWVSAYQQVVGALGENLGRWFGARFSPSGGRWLLKAAGKRGPVRLMLTQEDLAELVALIEAHFDGLSAQILGVEYTYPPDYAREWRAAGVVAPEVDVTGLIRDPIVAGQLHRVLTQGATLAEMRELAARAPVSRPIQLAMEHAEQHAADWITGFGQRLASGARTESIRTNRELGQSVIERYLKGTLKETRHEPRGHAELTPPEREALATGRVVEGWRGLASELYHTFKAEDATRDWLRVGWTETQSAYQHGRLLEMGERHAEDREERFIWRKPRPKACDACLRLYLMPDGSPRLFRAAEIQRNGGDNGGMNIGRRASKIGEVDGWLPVAGTTHPWCACEWMEYLPAIHARQVQFMADVVEQRKELAARKRI